MCVFWPSLETHLHARLVELRLLWCSVKDRLLSRNENDALQEHIINDSFSPTRRAMDLRPVGAEEKYREMTARWKSSQRKNFSSQGQEFRRLQL